MRSRGFILRFRSRLETMAVVCAMREVAEVGLTLHSENDALDIRIVLHGGEVLILRSNGFNALGWDRFLKKHFSQLLR